MKLLFITRKIDKQDPRVGFVSDWVEELASRVEKLYIITWQKSNRGGLPANVIIKDLKGNKFLKVAKMKLVLLRWVPKVDGVFTHMMPIYAIIAGWFAKFFGKKIVHWYAHGSVPFLLKVSRGFVDEYVTSSKTGFRMDTKKPVNVVGQGIGKFKIQKSKLKTKDDIFKIISVGRISPSKDYETMIKAIYDLNNKNVYLDIIGEPATKRDGGYLTSLQTMVKNMKLEKQVEFLGAIEHKKIYDYLEKADLFLNLSNTGSLDKAVLEAMNVGLIVLTSNEAYKEILPKNLMVERDQSEKLKEKISEMMNLDDLKRERIIQGLQKEVAENHSLNNLITKIVARFKK